MNRNRVGYSLALLIMLMITACGGGSDGDSSANYTPLAITDSNAKSLTENMLENMGNVGEQEGIDTLSSTTLFAKSAPMHRVLTRSTDSLAGVSKSTQTEECPNGGSITVTVFTEDQIGFDANNCTIQDAIDEQQIKIYIDGKATFTSQAPTGFPPRQDFPTDESWDTDILSFNEMEQLQGTFDKFLVELEGVEKVSITYDGKMLIKEGTNITDSLTYIGLSSANVMVTSPSLDLSLSAHSLESLSRIDSNGFEFIEMAYNTTYSSSKLGENGGQVTVTTLENLIHEEISAVPFVRGKLKISGAANSSVTVTIPGQASDVQLDIDSDGDGVTDNVLDLSWMELGVE